MKGSRLSLAPFSSAVLLMALAVTAGGEGVVSSGRLKADRVCANCHGLYGELGSGGNSAMSPKLTAQNEDYLSKRLADYRSGRLQHPQMSLVARMISEQDIADVASWYAAIEVAVHQNPDPRGREEASRFCAACHGLDGQAIASGLTVPNLTAQPRDYLITRLRDYRDGRIEQAQMTAIARTLSDANIEDIAAWYAGQRLEIIQAD